MQNSCPLVSSSSFLDSWRREYNNYLLQCLLIMIDRKVQFFQFSKTLRQIDFNVSSSMIGSRFSRFNPFHFLPFSILSLYFNYFSLLTFSFYFVYLSFSMVFFSFHILLLIFFPFFFSFPNTQIFCYIFCNLKNKKCKFLKYAWACAYKIVCRLFEKWKNCIFRNKNRIASSGRFTRYFFTFLHRLCFHLRYYTITIKRCRSNFVVYTSCKSPYEYN